MLVLGRRVGQAIVIDEKTVIRVEHISGRGVRLSFDGPARVVREEIMVRRVPSSPGPASGEKEEA